MKLTTLPVYSKLAADEDVPEKVRAKLPRDWRLSQHQVDTYNALTDSDYDVVFNTAMTGDGKSLAAYLPVLTDERQHVFGMYPTNELLRDQGRQFENYQRLFGLTRDQMPVFALWGAELTRLQEQTDFRSRGDFLKERFTNHNVILTNPDIFNLVMNYSYARGSRMFNDQELPYSLYINFDYFVFDEFHIFAIPQIIAALTAMLYITEESKCKFLFSSATMSTTLVEMIKRSGLRYRETKSNYCSEPAPEFRQVLYPATLDVHKLDKNANAETWVREHISELVTFWNSCNDNAKGVVIVNSVVAARRIARVLAQELEPHGISVGENTGLTDDERRREALQKNIIVGTSTIDVGVDFNINLLIFESTNGGTFLQRLGRLGRVKYNEPPFPKYQAHALMSPKAPWIYDRLEQALAERGVKDGDAVERSTILRDAVMQAFPDENDFIEYAKRWGILQAAHVVNVLENRRHQDAYASLAATLSERYRGLFNVKDFGKSKGKYWAIEKKEEHGRKILNEVLGFRGSTPFQIACWDATVTPETFLSYDLFPLVQNVAYSIADKEEYTRAVEKRFSDMNQQREALDAVKYTLGGESKSPLILRIEQFNEERDKLVLKSNQDFSLYSERVVVLNGFSIDEPRAQAVTSVNSILKRQSVVCYITKTDRGELRRRLRLPAHFPLYVVRDMHRNRDYTIAFGKTALLLDSVLLRFKNKNVEDEPIIL
ncbi:MAG: type I-D CRISPR-associated helicase Cas3' [Chloroflexi bacterium]|nr:type I-D CRISPR-associated helicase Cas3' [Chloroflexota bacterium]